MKTEQRQQYSGTGRDAVDTPLESDTYAKPLDARVQRPRPRGRHGFHLAPTLWQHERFVKGEGTSMGQTPELARTVKAIWSVPYFVVRETGAQRGQNLGCDSGRRTARGGELPCLPRVRVRLAHSGSGPGPRSHGRLHSTPGASLGHTGPYKACGSATGRCVSLIYSFSRPQIRGRRMTNAS